MPILIFNFKAIESDLLNVETDNNNKGFGVLRLFKCLLLQFMEDMSDGELDTKLRSKYQYAII
jgi:IS5 family transposase